MQPRNLPIAVVAAAKFLLHLYAGQYYGYFVDELYYLACSEHLDWGYVDQPPLIALVTWIARNVLGDSLTALHLIPAIAGAAKIILTGLIVRELGGGKFATWLATICVFIAPGFLTIDNWLSMNVFEPLFWMGCAYIILRLINGAHDKLWLAFGVLAGLGLQNKHSMLIFGFGLVAGLLLTPQRRLLFTRWPWIAGAITLAIFLPNLLWNIQHHFPFLEIQRNIRESGRNVDLNPLKFFAEVSLAMMPISAPIWIAGLWYFFANPNGKNYRALGWAWLITALLIITLNPRIYYLFPAFPLLFAAGSIEIESRLKAPRLQWMKPALAAVLLITGAILSPIALPILPPETFIQYSKAFHIEQPRVETHRLGPLPQLYADQFGWKEMAENVAKAYNNIPPDLRAKTAIFGQNYGQAGAIDFFGPKLGLPKALSGHQNYFLWGPRGYTGESVLVLGDREENLKRQFEIVEKVATVYHPYSMPYQHFDVFHCRGLKGDLRELWPKIKKWG